jgi:hypothetical protein
VSRDERDEHRPAYEIHHGRIRPLTVKGPRKKRSARGRTVAGVVALTGLLVGLPVLLVVDHQVRLGMDAAAVSADMNAEAGVRSAGEVVDPPAPPQDDSRLESGGLPQFDETATPPDKPLALVPAAPQPAATAAKYLTPFDYCADVPTADAPELAMVAQGVPDEIVEGMRELTKMPGAEVVWRCVTARVWVCAQEPGGVACGKVPTREERRAYCAANPGAANIVSAAGTWRCDGTTPVVPGGDQRTTDGRGFDRLVWLALPKPTAG